jgi:hypothetical protein
MPLHAIAESYCTPVSRLPEDLRRAVLGNPIVAYSFFKGNF